MNLNINPSSIPGLKTHEIEIFNSLIETYNAHLVSNAEKVKYYEGAISLNSVNLGIALPEGMKGLEIGCGWGAKAVDVLAARSMFDGYVGTDGNSSEHLSAIVERNQLIPAYMKACRDELAFGCTFATMSSYEGLSKIRFHSPRYAAAQWDGVKNRISAGFAVIDTAPDNTKDNVWTPSVINLYLWDQTIVFERIDSVWFFSRAYHKIGRPLMEPLVYNATTAKPFGRSRLKAPIRHLMDEYVRTIANAAIALEFATSPQKYLLGLTDEQYEQVVGQKFQQYVGSIIAATQNPETMQNPTFGQLVQGNISPHTEMLRILASQFAAQTGLTVADCGIVNDANPTSSEAILAQSQSLVGMAEQLNAGNAESLRNIALMALAIEAETSIANLPEEDRAIVAHFKNPAMPNVAVTADAAVKIAGAREGFAKTDTFLEMLGFSPADIRRIKSQETGEGEGQSAGEGSGGGTETGNGGSSGKSEGSGNGEGPGKGTGPDEGGAEA